MNYKVREESLRHLERMKANLIALTEGIQSKAIEDPQAIEYELNRLHIAIHNFKKVHLPKFKTHEKANLSPSRPDHVPYHARRKSSPSHG